ncbi:hypothetical protein HPB52_017873 [Rhipicephalus sanguineus]|uniref:Uncharacterized protein n=1 Tax=Rhipicephalus sanguineus TaxID=34632 RepID=A0A9D4QDP6_RHISA|nr:hypothetical protein HPB52_017873 [Rhipicephalus sanguineus]
MLRGLLLSGNPHLRAWFILPGIVPPSGHRASQDLRLALKRPWVLPTMATTVYRVVGRPLAPRPLLLLRHYHAGHLPDDYDYVTAGTQPDHYFPDSSTATWDDRL